MSVRNDAYLDYKAGVKYKDIAAKYGVSLSTVKSWAVRYWKAEKVATKDKKVATKSAKVATKRLQPKKHAGGAPRRNTNAVKHGLFAKYLPVETLSIVTEIDDASPLDILWANIKIKFASILRAQQIMFVDDADDNTEITETDKSIKIDAENRKEISSGTKTKTILSIEKQEMFLRSQSRAMDTLTHMIKQYDDMLRNDMATEEQRERINKLRAEVSKLTATDTDDASSNIAAYVDALRGEAAEVWNDESKDIE